MFDLVFVMTLLLGDVTHFSIWLLNCFVLSYPSSASIQMDHLTPSGQFDMSFLYWFLGALTSSKPLKSGQWKKLEKKTENCVQWRTISRHTCPMAATSGFGHSPRPLPLGNVLGIVPVDCQGQQNGRQVWCFFSFSPACNPIVRHQGNTTWAWVIDQWQRPVALSEALDPLHSSMYLVLYQHNSSVVKMAWTEVYLFIVDNFDKDLTLAY